MLALMLFGVVLIVVLWLLQTVFLDSYYRGFRTRQVRHTADQLAASADLDALREESGRLALRNDLCVLFVSQDEEGLHRLASAEGLRTCLIHRIGDAALAGWCRETGKAGEPITRLFYADTQATADRERTESAGRNRPPLPTAEADEEERQRRGGRTFGFLHMDEEKDRALALIYARQLTLPDGTAGTLILNTQITPVSSTVNALRSELLIITAFIIVGVMLLATFLAWYLGRPIIETNRAARSLSRAKYERPPHGNGYREIAELNTTLEEAAEELGQVETLQHELIANISHDLRTPLTMISGYAEAMRDIPDENTPDNMQIIIDEAGRLSTLVNELLDFSRMQTGSAEMNRQPFDLTEETAAIVARVGKLVSKDGYAVRFEPDAHLWVNADATRISQVIYNLIGNALTYTGEDRTVTVTQSVRGGHVRMEVRDTGKGIPPDELPLIWNRYYRTRETHRRAVIGSGLGLNIVRTILERHGARYGVDSTVGSGSVFWFELERADEA